MPPFLLLILSLFVFILPLFVVITSMFNCAIVAGCHNSVCREFVLFELKIFFSTSRFCHSTMENVFIGKVQKHGYGTGQAYQIIPAAMLAWSKGRHCKNRSCVLREMTLCSPDFGEVLFFFVFCADVAPVLTGASFNYHKQPANTLPFTTHNQQFPARLFDVIVNERLPASKSNHQS